MSKGFGDLSNLETLNLEGCEGLELLPASKSRHSESFYFLIFVLRRLWTVVVYDQTFFGRLQPAPVVDQPGSYVVSRQGQHVSCPQRAAGRSRLWYLRCTCHMLDSLSSDFDAGKLLSPLQ